MPHIMAVEQNIALAMCLLFWPTLSQKLVGKVVFLTFRQHLHVLPKLIVLGTGDVPVLLSLPQMKNLGTTIE